jgi:5-methylcytosine-specific restriction endonuclease McrA
VIKEKLDRAREIFSGYVLYEKFSADHVAEISSLTGVSLENVCKVKCPRTGKDNNFLVVRFSGETENYVGFSWKKRIEGKHGDKSLRTKEVLRRTITHQMMSFKSRHGSHCFFCGSEGEDMHVDHAWPTFSRILDEFIDKNGYPKTRKSLSGCGHVFADVSDERAWQEHHHRSVSLQILCQKCNLRKSDNDSVIMAAMWLVSQLSRARSGKTGDRMVDGLLSIGSLMLPTDHIYEEYK